MNNNSQGIGKACGKTILIGEHSVVYGMPAIALPIKNLIVECKLKIAKDSNSIKCMFFDGELESSPEEIRGIKTLITTLMNDYDKKHIGLEIEIKSNIPPQRGLGSSAAVSVAVVKAFYDLFNIALDNKILEEKSYIAEKIHHNNPSGIDSTTIISEKALYFIRDKQKDLLKINLNAFLIIADTGKQGNTSEAVSEVRKLLDEKPEDTNKLIENLGILADDSKKCIENNNPLQLGNNMNEAQAILKQLKVSDEKLDLLVDVAIKAGALGAKLTGGGKGGCMIALATDREQAEIIKTELINAGAKNSWIYNLSSI